MLKRRRHWRATGPVCGPARAAPLVRRRCLSSVPDAKPARDRFSIVGSSREGRAVYLDSQATMPLDLRVLDAMLPYMTQMYGNPHSRTQAYGWESADVVEESRAKVALLIGADAKEIIFTSGATESNNMPCRAPAGWAPLAAKWSSGVGVRFPVAGRRRDHLSEGSRRREAPLSTWRPRCQVSRPRPPHDPHRTPHLPAHTPRARSRAPCFHHSSPLAPFILAGDARSRWSSLACAQGAPEPLSSCRPSRRRAAVEPPPSRRPAAAVPAT